jgi:hypothetical protein
MRYLIVNSRYPRDFAVDRRGNLAGKMQKCVDKFKFRFIEVVGRSFASLPIATDPELTTKPVGAINECR